MPSKRGFSQPHLWQQVQELRAVQLRWRHDDDNIYTSNKGLAMHTTYCRTSGRRNGGFVGVNLSLTSSTNVIRTAISPKYQQFTNCHECLRALPEGVDFSGALLTLQSQSTVKIPATLIEANNPWRLQNFVWRCETHDKRQQRLRHWASDVNLNLRKTSLFGRAIYLRVAH